MSTNLVSKMKSKQLLYWNETFPEFSFFMKLNIRFVNELVVLNPKFHFKIVVEFESYIFVNLEIRNGQSGELKFD